MPYVTVKNKFQVVIPAAVRKQVRIKVGDLLEAKAERGNAVFVPKSAVDRGIAESLEEFKKGRAYGPFETAEEAVAFLHAQTKKLRIRKKKRRRS